MSMNLNAKIDGVNCELYQTPTHITHMCTVQSDGKVSWNLVAGPAIHALRIYIEWIKGNSDGGWTSRKQRDEFYKFANEHIAKIEKMIKKSKKSVEVWIT